MFTDGEGDFTMAGARALEACARAGVEVVVVTGRGLASAQRDARILGVTSLVCECGGVLVLDGETQWLAARDDEGRTPHEQIDRSGAPALLLERFAAEGLRYLAPYHLGREVTHLLCGRVDAADGQALLDAHGHGDLRLLDNGAAPDGERILILLPEGISKATGVAAHRRARGYAERDCIAVGDSPEDVGMAAVVGRCFGVANGVGGAGVLRTEKGYGAGVYEAVVTTLTERRAQGPRSG